MQILLYILLAIVVAALLYVAFAVVVTQRWKAKAEAQVPPAGSFVDVDGNRIHYIDEGNGPPIVFVHGLGAQLHQFRHPLFARLRDDFRLIAIDRPGAGYSVAKPGATGELKEQAAVVADFIRTLGLEKPLLVGHSLGGMISLTLALEHPGAVSGLALMSPLTHQIRNAPAGFAALDIRSPLKRWFIAETFAVPASAKYARQTLDAIFAPQKPDDDYMVEGGGLLGLRPSHFYGTSTDYVDTGHGVEELSARYGEIDIPVGIIYGDKDHVLSFEAQGQSMVGQIKNLDFEVLEGVGHMPQFAAPERVEAFIRRMAARAFA